MIPEDLKIEIRKEIQKFVKEELSLAIVSDKELKKALINYMKSILYGELKYLKMLESGFKKIPNGTVFLVEKKSRQLGWIDLSKYRDKQLTEIHKQLYDSKKTDTVLSDFISIMRTKSENKINWIDMVVRNKHAINTYSIFDFLYSLDSKIIELQRVELERFLKSLVMRFSKNGEDFSYKSIYDSFNKWKNKKIEHKILK